ncbi:zinc metalloproteinase nas-8 [Caerostris darwini]|uniref:Metalloendopeptidase n=1 Tax=Caerostris darwini TaxID=1538125 RepID=A0AAV4TWU9_9ARAC|nr:zinc metalloproteinase nas-8 [Caerostris darwini]
MTKPSLGNHADEKGRFLIAKAMLEFHKTSCIRFVPRTTETDYIEISPNGGCSSHIGRVGGAQSVTLGRGCYTVGIMVHELMHTLGFVHEQNRPDRDDYITVLWDNVKEGEYQTIIRMDMSTFFRIESVGAIFMILLYYYEKEICLCHVF